MISNILDIFNDLDRIFNDGKPVRALNMHTDIEESDKEFLLDVELPGFDKSEVELSFKDGYLTIKAAHKEMPKNNNKIVSERTYNASERTYYFGDINYKNIKASMDKGVLTVHIPKEGMIPETNKIAIE